MNIGIIQFDIVRGEKTRNFSRVEQMVDALCRSASKPDVIVLPELWSTGYVLDQLGQLATMEGEEEVSFLAALARRYNVWFAGGSVAAKTVDGLTNRAQIFNREGELEAWYDKVHLVPMFREEQFLVAGKKSCLHTIEGISFGFLICYDLRFGELARKLALQGAQAMIVAAQWPLLRLHHWQTLLAARAIENQLYLFAANTVSTGSSPFAGHSQALDPDGALLHCLEFEEGSLCVEMDLSHIAEIRKDIPVFRDRKPDVYQLSETVEVGFPKREL